MTTSKPFRAALYLRVSTKEQNTERQLNELTALAAHRGWEVVKIYEDMGISGSKGREKRPGLDNALKDATRGRYDVLLVWAVDRLGRSLKGLLESLEALHTSNTGLVILSSGIDTTTPAGKAMFSMLGVFSEFERNIIQERVRSGVTRYREKHPNKQWGRRPLSDEAKADIVAELSSGLGIQAVAKKLKRGVAAVHAIKREMDSTN